MVSTNWLHGAWKRRAVSEDIDYDTACTPARDMPAALKLMGLLERLPTDQEWKDEEEQAG